MRWRPGSELGCALQDPSGARRSTLGLLPLPWPPCRAASASSAEGEAPAAEAGAAPAGVTAGAAHAEPDADVAAELAAQRAELDEQYMAMVLELEHFWPGEGGAAVDATRGGGEP
jgi:hypothetical protein